MSDQSRSVRGACLSALFGLFCLPTLIFGGYLLICWFQTHRAGVYYANYKYVGVASIFLAAAALSACATWFGAWRRSFYGLLFLVPVISGLAAMVAIPDMLPRTSFMIADTNYLSDIQSFLRVWYEANHRFPSDESEFGDALSKGPAAWQYRVGPVPTSQYMEDGKFLSYEIIVERDANGPRLSHMLERPGVIYYSVSHDLQEFWVTMTSLKTDFGSASSIKRAGGQSTGDVWIVHATGKEYPEDKNKHSTATSQTP